MQQGLGEAVLFTCRELHINTRRAVGPRMHTYQYAC